MRMTTAVWRGAEALILVVALALAQGASAQYETGEEGVGDQAPAIDESGEDSGLPGPVPDFNEAPSQYTVERGDTLWDITQRFLNNPWYWPKVWSRNPHIENPNWIEPGTIINFQETEILDIGPPDDPPDDPPEDEIPIEPGLVTGEVKRLPPKNLRLIDKGFITRRELDEAGYIDSSWEEKNLLSTFDKVYVVIPKGTRVGENFVVFRKERIILDPRTGDEVGYFTIILGTAQIQSAPGDALPTAMITSTQRAMERGDRLLPWSDALSKEIIQRQNQVELEAIVLATVIPRLHDIGEHHFIFIDKGKKHGVEIGNTFTIVRRGDPLDIDYDEEKTARLPWETIGGAMVVDARDEVSTAIVFKTIREVFVGDRCVMEVGGRTAMR